MYLTDEKCLELAAQHAHQGNRLWCAAHNHPPIPAWEDATEQDRESTRIGVRGVLAGNTPRDSHASWLRTRKEQGWVYGEVKDVEKKTHPCLVPYEDLPPDQRAKDTMFVHSVRAVMEAAYVARSST
jgi:hypothetical protein